MLKQHCDIKTHPRSFACAGGFAQDDKRVGPASFRRMVMKRTIGGRPNQMAVGASTSQHMPPQG
jgi:hypothetical protein